MRVFKNDRSVPRPQAPRQPDVRIEHHGSIVLLRPYTTGATVWLTENVADDAIWFAGALAVEPRYVNDLVVALRGAGMEVQ